MQESDQHSWERERLNAWRATGNRDLLGQLIKRQRDRAYATALRILGNREDAEDAVQQACIKLMSRTHGLDTPEQFNVTVYRAVVQCALDMARANRVRAKLEKAMSPTERDISPIPQVAAEQAEALLAVWQELNTMSEESRALVVLCYQEGLSVTDAAEVFSVPRETLRDRLTAAMTDLRRKLSQRGVILSLLIITGLIRHGRAEAAPDSLCVAIDQAVPGPSCVDVPTAQPPTVNLDAYPLPAGCELAGPPHTISFPLVLGIAAALLLGVGVWFALNSSADSPPKLATASAPWLQSEVSGAKRSTPETETKEAGAGNAEESPSERKSPATPLPTAQGHIAARATSARNNTRDEPVALDKLPAAIRETALAAIAGVRLKGAERKTGDNGTVYELKGEAGGKNYEIVVDTDGKFVTAKLDDDDDDDEADVKVKPVPPPTPPKSDF